MAKATRPEEQETPNIRPEDVNQDVLIGGENFPGAGEEVKADPNDPIVDDPTGTVVGGSTGRGTTDVGKSHTSGGEATDQYRGKLLKGDRVIIEPIGFVFENRAAPGAPEDWTGSFVDPADKTLRAGEACRLVLVDGRSAEIVLGEPEVHDDRPSRITFRALGPLR